MEAKQTTDHEEIRRWVEARDGKPACVEGTKDLLRIDFPRGDSDDKLSPLSWDDFFEAFDKNKLAFLYQDEGESRFNKFIDR